jgi:hypothetical protein
MAVLTGIDVLGVQRFVFSSNRLKDVVTGSYLVEWSTSREGAFLGLRKNGLIEKDEDILLAGGANAFIVFSDKQKARAFAAKYTRLLYEEAPGVETVIVHEEIGSEGLIAALQKIQIKLAQEKTERIPSVPLAGISVNSTCMETGLPAVDFTPDESNRPISRNIAKRRQKEIRDNANGYWKKCLLKGREEFDFPLKLEELGCTVGDTSLIGVVHIDGNGLGELIKKWLRQKNDSEIKDNQFRQEYKEWSKKIDELGYASLQAVVDRLCDSVKDGSVTGKPERLVFDLKKTDSGNGWMLPLRPILLGGDDLTFVCDGRIALDLAETALGIFESEKSNIPHLDKPIRACAGVAIVRVRSPFIRAYQLAEKLCASAKMKTKASGGDHCAIDWHIGLDRPGGSLSELRDRHYKVARAVNSADSPIELTCRPYLLGSANNPEEESWRWLRMEVLDNQKYGLRGKAWADKRNKVKALPEVLRGGPNTVRNAIKAWGFASDVKLDLQMPLLNSADGFFDHTRTPLFDAVELVDLHLNLMEKAGNESVPKANKGGMS